MVVRINGVGTIDNSARSAPASGYISRSIPMAPGHAWSYAGLWAFTALLVFRPAEMFPGLGAAQRLPFLIATLTLLVFCSQQFWTEGRLSARPREVTLLAALCVGALVSVPWAYSPSEAIATFMDSFIKIVLMFLVMVNAVRNEKRLMGLLWLVLGAGTFLSFGALQAFRQGQFSDEGYRVRGSLGSTLTDPNDTALFLVTLIPIAIALALSARGRLAKIVYSLMAILMTGAIFVTYSRGGFLALAFAGVVLGSKLFKRAPIGMLVFILVSLVAVPALLPSNYTDRLASIFTGGDTRGSAAARRNLLTRSIEVAADNPLVGVGMGNFHLFSIKDQVSHNSYTQVAAEMGLPTLGIYLAFLLAPISRMRRIERETRGVSNTDEYRRIHFLSMGLQASLVGFLIGSFFLSVAYYWFLYYLVGYAVCVGRIYETGPGRIIGTYSMETAPS
jgi:putative inorganic carbon (HCO3(-)) transporter